MSDGRADSALECRAPATLSEGKLAALAARGRPLTASPHVAERRWRCCAWCRARARSRGAAAAGCSPAAPTGHTSDNAASSARLPTIGTWAPALRDCQSAIADVDLVKRARPWRRARRRILAAWLLVVVPPAAAPRAIDQVGPSPRSPTRGSAQQGYCVGRPRPPQPCRGSTPIHRAANRERAAGPPRARPTASAPPPARRRPRAGPPSLGVPSRKRQGDRERAAGPGRQAASAGPTASAPLVPRAGRRRARR
jgi:hypothetical protein